MTYENVNGPPPRSHEAEDEWDRDAMRLLR